MLTTLRVYRDWEIAPVSGKKMVAQKGRHSLVGTYDELVNAIDKYEKKEKEAEDEKGEEDNIC